MDKILLPISCKNYHINFNLNLTFRPNLVSLVNPTPVAPNFYGALYIYRIPSPDEEKERGGGPFPLVKSYSFSQFSQTQTFPLIKRITVKNFIANLPLIVSIFDSIIFNNKNPWVQFLPTPEHPEQPGHFMNLKTKEVSQTCPKNIYPWVEYLETGGGGRHYYVSSLTSESSWTLPEVYEGDGEPYINTVLKEIIACLQNIIDNPQQTQMLIDEMEKFHKERKDKDKLMNKKITRVFIIAGHSYCSIEKIPIQDPKMCVMTLSKLGDNLLVSASNFLSDINQIVKSPPQSVVSSYVELAKRYRETQLYGAEKDKNQSIRVRCGSYKSTVSNQIFFGGTKSKTYIEGVFMLDAAQRGEYEDISLEILTPTGMKNIYPETTEFQKRIIEFESQRPDITSIPLDAYKKYFESEPQFDLEFKNLQRQRRLFCTSLDYSEDTEEMDRDALMYRGIDVETLQHYYDCIVKWEKENDMFANEYFEETQDGLEIFMDKFGIPHKEEKDKINKNYLLNLSVQRMRQLINYFDKIKSYGLKSIPKNPIVYIQTDFQIISSLYQQTSCRDILQRMQDLFPGDEKLVVFAGCRGVYGERNPYHSDNEGEYVDTGGSRKGRRRQHLTMKMKIKSTFKKNKKLTRTRMKNNKKTARTRIKNKNKKLTRNRVRKNKKYFY